MDSASIRALFTASAENGPVSKPTWSSAGDSYEARVPVGAGVLGVASAAEPPSPPSPDSAGADGAPAGTERTESALAGAVLAGAVLAGAVLARTPAGSLESSLWRFLAACASSRFFARWAPQQNFWPGRFPATGCSQPSSAQIWTTGTPLPKLAPRYQMA